MVVLDERHHTFLQALMRRGPLPEGESKKMHRELFGASDDQFFEFLSTVNKELDYLQMEVRGSANQYSNRGMLYYGIVNKLANAEAKLGTRLHHAQLTFFKAILDSIMSDTSGTGTISSMQALNLRLDTQNESQTQAEASTSQAAPLKMTLAAKEDSLTTLVADNWLGRTEDGMVCLGIKSFLELRSLFKNFDVPFCDVCNEAAIKAQPCQNEDCPVRMHLYCVPRKFSRRQVPRVCPGCRTAWRMLEDTGDGANTSDQEGHEVAGQDDNTGVHMPTSTGARRATRASQRRKAKLEESSDDENGNDNDEDESDGSQPAPSPPVSQRKVIHSRKKMKVSLRKSSLLPIAAYTISVVVLLWQVWGLQGHERRSPLGSIVPKYAKRSCCQRPRCPGKDPTYPMTRELKVLQEDGDRFAQELGFWRDRFCEPGSPF